MSFALGDAGDANGVICRKSPYESFIERSSGKYGISVPIVPQQKLCNNPGKPRINPKKRT